MSAESETLVGQDAELATTPAWRVLLTYVRPYWRTLLVGGLLSVATTATGLALPLVARYLIENLSEDRSVAGPLVVMTVLVVANALIGALGVYVLRRAGESVVLTARRWLAERLLRLRMSAVEQAEPGDLMSRVTADTTLLREVTADSLVGAVTGLLALAGTIAMMALLDPVLLGITLTVLLSAVAVLQLVVPRIKRAARHADRKSVV